MADSAHDKSIAPTPHRRQQAREQGHVAQSHDLVAAGLLIAALATMLALGGRLIEFLIALAQRQLGGEAWLSADSGFAVHQWYSVLIELAKVLAPVLGLLLAAAVAMHLLQIGLLWNPERALPDFSRISPLAGWQRIFSLTGGVRLSFGLVKLIVVLLVVYWSVSSRVNDILDAASHDVPHIGACLVDIVVWTSIKIAAALVLVGAADYAYQWWRHERDLRMTPQELREEMRTLQGDPQLVLRRRSAQRELLAAQLATAAAQADIVVTGGSALAVALRFDAQTMAAPIVVAKGVGVIAERIRQSALRHGISTVERKPLAQSLYRSVGLKTALPEPLFAPVAELLAQLYQQQGRSLPRIAA